MTPSSFEADLAFMKGLADGDAGRRQQALFGRLYFAAGLLYGLQVVLQWGRYVGLFELPISEGLLILAVNAAFLGYLAWEIWRNRGMGEGTMVTRGVNATFGAIGAANVAVLIILFVGAWRLKNPGVAMLVPCVIFALQGAAWFVAFTLRKRAWLGVVALGWMVTAVAVAFFIGTPTAVALIGVGIVLWMAIPGFVMMRLSRDPA